MCTIEVTARAVSLPVSSQVFVSFARIGPGDGLLDQHSIRLLEMQPSLRFLCSCTRTDFDRPRAFSSLMPIARAQVGALGERCLVPAAVMLVCVSA